MSKGQRNRENKKNRQSEPTGDEVEVRYNGPAMTPWSVAYLWATVLTNLRDWTPGSGSFAEYQAGDSADRVLLARAISITAREQGLLGDNAVPGPGVLSPLSLSQVATGHLDPELQPIIEFTQHELGHQPTAGELGYQPYTDVYERIRSDAVTAEDVLADDRLRAHIEHVGEQLVTDAQAAFTAIVQALNSVATKGADDVVLGQLGGYLNEYLSVAVLPDQDTEFRTLLEQQVGWPGGNPPAGLVNSTGEWYKVGWSPGTTDNLHRKAARAWCRWVVERGWATPNVPGDLDYGAWMAVPEPWAWPLGQAGRALGGGAMGVMPWRSWPKGDGGDRPGDEFLRTHYGQTPA